MSVSNSVYTAYSGNTYLFGGNAPYVEEMYENYLANPGSVDDTWRAYFDALQYVPASDGSAAKDVPHMPVRMASEARRFTWLVDVLYDRRVKLIMSAAVPPEGLYTAGPMSHEFPRTVSRLHEMQSKEFLAQERRLVDTGLT